MPFDASNDYGPFDNIDSGESGTIEGLLPLDGPASAFRYRKQIIVNVFIDLGFGIGFKDVRGRWKVRLRADASRNADGSYAGEILFEQEIEWTARVVVLNLGVAFVSWQPLGDGGSGKQFTSVVNGTPCALYGDDASAATAYGDSGAWLYIDRTVRADSTPAQKYDTEKGFSIFSSEGAATVGSYQFFAVWQSQDYLCDVPEFGILETVEDTWAVGTLDSESLYTFSSKPGDVVSHCVQHPELGKTFFLYAKSGDVYMSTTRLQQGFGRSSDDALAVTGAKPVALWRIGGRTAVASEKAGAVSWSFSGDDGANWEHKAMEITGIKVLAEGRSNDGAQGYFVGKASADAEGIVKGDWISLIVKYDSNKGTFVESARRVIGGDLPAKGVTLSRLFVDGDTLRLIGFTKTDVLWWESRDELATLTQLKAPGGVSNATP